MTHIDIPLIDVHTHIGTLPGAAGDIYYPEDLLYIAEREGARYMLASSASVTTIGRAYGMAQTVDMVRRFGDRLGVIDGKRKPLVEPHELAGPEFRDLILTICQGHEPARVEKVRAYEELAERITSAERFPCPNGRLTV